MDEEERILWQLSEWIDTETIARNILEELRWQSYKLSFENGKAVWLSALEDIGEEFDICVKSISDLEE